MIVVCFQKIELNVNKKEEERRGGEDVYGHGYLSQLAVYCLQRSAGRDIRKFRRRAKIRHEKEKSTSH
jgi:hypothetical protein